MRSISHAKYAKALYNIASKNNVDEAVFHDLEAIDTLFRDQHFQEVFHKLSFLPKEAMRKNLDHLFEKKIHPFSLNLLKILFEKGIVKFFHKISQSYRRIYFAGNGIDEIIVRSARSLSDDEQKKLIETLKKKKSEKLNVSFEEDQSLIGGIQMFEKGYLYDRSVQHYLKSLERFLLSEERE